jgi:hypothetical protein
LHERLHRAEFVIRAATRHRDGSSECCVHPHAPTTAARRVRSQVLNPGQVSRAVVVVLGHHRRAARASQRVRLRNRDGAVRRGRRALRGRAPAGQDAAMSGPPQARVAAANDAVASTRDRVMRGLYVARGGPACGLAEACSLTAGSLARRTRRRSPHHGLDRTCRRGHPRIGSRLDTGDRQCPRTSVAEGSRRRFRRECGFRLRKPARR